MKNKRGFILLESVLALMFVMLIGICALRLVASAGEVYARGQSLSVGVQLAIQEAHGLATTAERYSIRRQSMEQQLAAGISIRKTLIGVYDEQRSVYILSLLVYE